MNYKWLQIFAFLSAIQLVTLVLWFRSGSHVSSTQRVTIQQVVHSNVSNSLNGSAAQAVYVPEEFDWFKVDESVRLKCDEEKVKAFFKNNPAYERKWKRPRSKNNMNAQFDNLVLTKKVLDGLGVKFFLSHGTLLGWKRECGIIEHTNDVDIGVPYKYMKGYHHIINAMTAAGFKVLRMFGSLERGLEMSFRRKNYNVDLFTFYKDVVRSGGNETESIWNSMWWSNHLMRRMGFPVTDFVTAEWRNHTFLVPRLVDLWLEADYGKNWYKALDKWDWYTNPRNYLDETIVKKTDVVHEQEKFGYNLVKNPSFEMIDNNTGLPLHWKLEAKGKCQVSISNDDVRHGKYSVRMFNPDVNSWCMLSQEIVLNQKQKQKILISGWSRKETVENSIFGWGDHYSIWWQATRAPRNTAVTAELGAEFGIQTEGWQYSSHIITPNHNLNKFKVFVKYLHYQGAAYFDYISVRTEVGCPEACSGNGECIYGTCKCFLGWTGQACNSTVD